MHFENKNVISNQKENDVQHKDRLRNKNNKDYAHSKTAQKEDSGRVRQSINESLKSNDDYNREKSDVSVNLNFVSNKDFRKVNKARVCTI